MIETVEEGLEKYKDELEEYLRWITMCKKQLASSLGIAFEEVNVTKHFTEKDYGRKKLWDKYILGMQEALDITVKESRQIIEEIEAETKGQ